ncbi:uncharacterized protein Z518_08207 [Rhinocladiella mackenziei CBS 650.93]|uniref:Uncharacterized protein n=1 Tax=Rhinocladiella mackenziei CBS 650.93 TaxID=1442369 RepID=A0A0D2GVG6_9EURO|nr:uncharacterized protein Z518_08207 [Rhinocladiella mackenziei CBS 650.93]KIX02268.1 hypothetical protein Z518_08207 [Rhinocladiella mackenziei CBS 650.93]
MVDVDLEHSAHTAVAKRALDGGHKLGGPSSVVHNGFGAGRMRTAICPELDALPESEKWKQGKTDFLREYLRSTIAGEI